MLFRRNLGGLPPKKAVPIQTLTTGLVSWWPMTEASGATRVDVKGPHNLANGEGAVSQVAGQVETFASGFPGGGSNRALTIGDVATLPFHQTWTVMMWLKPTIVLPTPQGLMGKHHTEFRAFMLGSDSGAGGGVLLELVASQPIYFASLTMAEWALLIWFYDPIGGAGGSKNGGARSVQAVTSQIPDGSNAFWIGQEAGSGFPFIGSMGPCAFWNRILGDAEVAALWNNGDGLAYNEL